MEHKPVTQFYTSTLLFQNHLKFAFCGTTLDSRKYFNAVGPQTSILAFLSIPALTGHKFRLAAAQAHWRESRPWQRDLWISSQASKTLLCTSHHCLRPHPMRVNHSYALSKASLCRNTQCSRKAIFQLPTKGSNFQSFSKKCSVVTIPTICTAMEFSKPKVIQTTWRSASKCFAKKALVSSWRFNENLTRNRSNFHQAASKLKRILKRKWASTNLKKTRFQVINWANRSEIKLLKSTGGSQGH